MKKNFYISSLYVRGDRGKYMENRIYDQYVQQTRERIYTCIQQYLCCIYIQRRFTIIATNDQLMKIKKKYYIQIVCVRRLKCVRTLVLGFYNDQLWRQRFFFLLFVENSNETLDKRKSIGVCIYIHYDYQVWTYKYIHVYNLNLIVYIYVYIIYVQVIYSDIYIFKNKNREAALVEKHKCYRDSHVPAERGIRIIQKK